MKQQLTSTLLICACLICGTMAHAAKFKVENADDLSLDFWGFAQLTAESFDRQDMPSNPDLGDRDGVEFDADRVRFGAKMKWGRLFANLHFDANNTTPGRRTGGLASFIRDANGGYRFSKAALVKVGQFKTPLGMAFNMSGKKLPLNKRTLTDRLAFDRTLGIMLSGRAIGGFDDKSGFGYDLFYGNPVGRAGTARQTGSQVGDAATWVARLSYDVAKRWHLEASLGEVQDAGGKNTEDLQTWDIGIRGKIGKPFSYRAEYISADNVRGKDNDQESAWFVEGAYAFTKMIEGVVRYQQARFEPDLGEDTDISIFDVGVNVYLGQNKTNGRLQISYQSVGGDEEKYTGRATTGGFSDHRWDALLGQLQVSY